MLKLIGVSMVSCGLAAAGFWFSAQTKRRLASLEDASRAVELLKIRITNLLEPLDKAICALAPQNPLLCRLRDAQNEPMTSVLRKEGLSSPETEILQELFAAIPGSAAGSTAHFDTALERLRIQTELQRKAVQQSAALYPKLGLLAGAAVFLLLI